MVELILRALYESSSKILAKHWIEAQKIVEQNKIPNDNHFIKGCNLVWSTILTRLCNGCTAKDEWSIFYQWLTDYRTRLVDASKSEEGIGNIYVEGQVVAFNSFLDNIARLSKSSQAYQSKAEEISQKRKELNLLEEELNGIVWNSQSIEEKKGEL